MLATVVGGNILPRCTLAKPAALGCHWPRLATASLASAEAVQSLDSQSGCKPLVESAVVPAKERHDADHHELPLPVTVDSTNACDRCWWKHPSPLHTGEAGCARVPLAATGDSQSGQCR